MNSRVSNLYGSFLSPDTAKLARLFTEVKFPAANFNPATPPGVQPFITETETGSFSASSKFSGNMSASISTLLGVDLSHAHNSDVTITFNTAEIVRLGEVDDIAQALFGMDGVSEWIQQQWRKNEHVYFITGYVLVGGVHVNGSGSVIATADAKVSINVANIAAPAAAAALSALAIGDPTKAAAVSVSGGIQDSHNNAFILGVTHPTVIAVGYREVRLMGSIGTWVDHHKAKTAHLGAFQPNEFYLHNEEYMALYLPTRGI